MAAACRTFIGLATIGCSLRLQAQSPAVAIRGRVFRADSTPIANARVDVIRAGARRDSSITGPNGLYVLRIGVGETDTLSVTAVGYRPATRIVFIPGEPTPIVDFFLARTPTSLAPIRVLASRRRRPARQGGLATNAASDTRTAAAGAVVLGTGGLDPSVAAASAPGITAMGGGFSVLGLPSNQNSVALNGMEVNGVILPRDVTAFSTVTTGTPDLSRGGFSGAQLNIQTVSGSDVVRRSLHLTADNRRANTGVGYSGIKGSSANYVASAAASGPISRGHAYYTFALQYGEAPATITGVQLPRSSNETRSAVAAAVTAANKVGLPLGDPVLGTKSYFGSIFTRVDASQSADLQVSVTASANGSESPASAGAAVASTSTESASRQSGAVIQASAAQYLAGGAVLHEPRIAWNVQRRRSLSTASIPSASVAVVDSSGTEGVTSVLFGGSPSPNWKIDTRSVQAIDDISWNSLNNRHHFHVSIGAASERAYSAPTNGNDGIFAFASPQALETGTAEAFTRILPNSAQALDVLSAFGTASDVWQRTPRLRLEYGARVDKGSVLGATGYRPEQLGSGPSPRLPDFMSLSPRVGASWSYGQLTKVKTPQGDPTGLVRLTLGRYGGTFRAASLQQLVLIGSQRTLQCFGAAAPSPQWSNFGPTGAGATDCLSGSTSTDASYGWFASDYRPSSTWRANLGWTRFFTAAPRLDVDVIVSRTTNLPSAIDRSFSGVEAMRLPDEAGRPVYVPASAIDKATGFVDARSSVTESGIHSVEEVSDMRSVGRSVALTLTPLATLRRQMTLTYVLTSARSQSRGFDATTGDSPSHAEWSRSEFSARHQLTALALLTAGPASHLELYLRAQSGQPFTPIVDRDINGDGRTNDRAFIFGGGAVSKDVAAQIKQLIEQSPAASCLRRQVGVMAQPNSCEGPWSFTANMNWHTGAVAARVSSRVSADFGIQNLLGALDLLLHGSDVHGWGPGSAPDAVLLHPTGFDAVTSHFLYAVNRHFGRALPAVAGAANVQASLGVRIALGPDLDRQELEQQLADLAAVPGDSDVARLKSQLERNVPNAALLILRNKDTLALSPVQVSAISQLVSRYAISCDLLWAPFAEYIASLRLNYATPQTLRLYRNVREQAYRNAAELSASLNDILTRRQIAMLPPALRRYLDSDAVFAMRSSGAF